jgi:hypothetical protein
MRTLGIVQAARHILHAVPQKPAVALPSAEADAALLHEAVVLAEEEVLLDLRHRVERDADDDEERRAAELERHR